jgi:RecB family endonuclease NucS
MRVFKIENSSLTSYREEDFKIDNVEKILEEWIENSPNAVFEDEEVLIIGRQVTTNLGKAVDLLGLDKKGNTVVIELKREKTPRETVAQILEYASNEIKWVINEPVSEEFINNVFDTILFIKREIEDAGVLQ